jgi:hypothetical protein
LLTWNGNAANRLRGTGAVFNLQPTCPPYHVFGFNPRALRAALGEHGIQIESLEIRGGVGVRPTRSLRDRAVALVAEGVQRLGNLTSTSHDMFVWARKP